ncbi:unnamed protein product [Nippostrongylus brasiliensis]|uniref:Reverse transcriptase domain-containing protein n=1 Tax=Nippostrongylus brasiliensis TaxID=27835 RepID=A0A0N4YXP0_NIPBR|nr:unnamed protein product [Nippostrongylus brasiliensis]
MEVNKDPAVQLLLVALGEKIPQMRSDNVEDEERSRSIVVSGLIEANHTLPASARQRDLESKIDQLLDVLDVECRPTKVYRMDVFIRRSMTADERKHEYELRKTARERNEGKDIKEWVVYKGELVHVSSLPNYYVGNH